MATYTFLCATQLNFSKGHFRLVCSFWRNKESPAIAIDFLSMSVKKPPDQGDDSNWTSYVFRDFANEPVDRNAPTEDSLYFPIQLHKMLTQAEAEGFSQTCSWVSHGRAFQVSNRKAFTEKVLPLFFKQVCLAS